MSFSEGRLGLARVLAPLFLFAVLLHCGGPVCAAQDKKAADGEAQKKPPIPRLPAEQLQKQTRTRPDPAKSQVELEKIKIEL